MTHQLPVVEAATEMSLCKCRKFKYRSAIVNVLFAGKTVLFVSKTWL